MADPKISRGYRNCNPCNLDYHPQNKWQGQLGIEVGVPHPRFALFSTHQYGIRAACMLLIAYQDKYGLRTIDEIVARWAPGNENDTEAYQRSVAEYTGRSRTDRLELHTHADLRPLVEAIINHELGGMPYDARTLDEGLTMAGVAPPATAAVVVRTAPVKVAAGMAAVGSAGVGFDQWAPLVTGNLGGIAEVVRALGPWVVAVLLVLAAVCFAIHQYRRQRQVGA